MAAAINIFFQIPTLRTDLINTHLERNSRPNSTQPCPVIAGTQHKEQTQLKPQST